MQTAAGDSVVHSRHWLFRHTNFLVMAAALIIVGGVLGIIHLADEVKEGDTQKFDDWAIHALRAPNDKPAPKDKPAGPDWAIEAGRDITALGGVTVLTLVTAVVLGFLHMSRKKAAARLVLAATVGAAVVTQLLKWLVDRPRPSVSHFSYVTNSSFPSGHAMLSAAVYLTLGSLLTRLVPSRRLKLYCLSVAFLVTFLVGVSRVYMGVHYPTDVLAGWTAGLVWALVCWMVARWLQHRGVVERDRAAAAPAEV